jgi:hypothetical protein
MPFRTDASSVTDCAVGKNGFPLGLRMSLSALSGLWVRPRSAPLAAAARAKANIRTTAARTADETRRRVGSVMWR